MRCVRAPGAADVQDNSGYGSIRSSRWGRTASLTLRVGARIMGALRVRPSVSMTETGLSMEQDSSSKQGVARVWIWLAAIVGVAAFFRLYELGMSAFRGDTILLWSMAVRKVPPGQVLMRWFDVSGAAGQMPMPAFLMQLFLELIGWKITPFTVRVTFAFFGILAVPVAFMGGRRLFGDRFGLFLAALLALNSFHIATSREAYFYSTLLLGYFLFFWFSAVAMYRIRRGEILGGGDLGILAAALFFSAYSQITGLLICVAGALLFGGMVWYRQRKTPAMWQNLIRMGVVYGVVLLPVLLASWGLRPILAQIGASKAAGEQFVAQTGGSLLTGVKEAATLFTWGWTVWGWALLIVAVVVGVGAALRLRERRFLWVLYFIVAQIALFAVSRSAAGANYEARYMSGTLPFFLAFVAYGLLMGIDDLLYGKVPQRVRSTAGAALAGVGLLACVYPAYLQTQLTGKPTPYYDLVRWTDSNLPQGTPVLVDRWFEPWNELKAHPTTNVFFTFTVPNEPVETYIKNRWRETAQAFFAKYPEAAYLEIAKSYWEVPGVGPWNWPREHFARHIAITNEAGLKLRHMGLANRGDFYAVTTNRTIVEIFYNTHEDLAAKARAQGRQNMVLFGPGWGYTKTQDFRDWRALEKEAALEVYNLTDQPMDVMVRLRAVAPNGSKRVQSATMDAHDFSVGRMEDWDMGPISLAPGPTVVVLRDPFWTDGGVPLLVDMVAISMAPQPAAAPAPAAAP